MAVEVGGQDEQRAAIVENLELQPLTRAETVGEFFSLLYVRAPHLPAGVLGLRSPTLKETRLIAPSDWSNIWIYGLEIFIAGWLTKAEFRALSQKLPAGALVKQYSHTQIDNRAVPMRHLRPLAELAALVKNSAWGRD